MRPMPRPFNRERSPLGEALRRLRREHGNVSQRNLARRTKELAENPDDIVSDSHIAQMETGDRGASLETLNALAKALGLNGVEYQELLEAGGVELSNKAIIVKFNEDYSRDVFVPVDMLPAEDEEELLSAYGELDPAGRDIVLAYARSLIEERRDEIKSEKRRRTEAWMRKRQTELEEKLGPSTE